MRAIVAAALANTGIAIAKFTGFVITGSSSMLAESIHSLADTTNRAAGVRGRRAARPATPEHPSDTGATVTSGRSSSPWSCSAPACVRAYEGVQKLRSPTRLDTPPSPSASSSSPWSSNRSRCAPP